MTKGGGSCNGRAASCSAHRVEKSQTCSHPRSLLLESFLGAVSPINGLSYFCLLAVRRALSAAMDAWSTHRFSTAVLFARDFETTETRERVTVMPDCRPVCLMRGRLRPDNHRCTRGEECFRDAVSKLEKARREEHVRAFENLDSLGEIWSTLIGRSILPRKMITQRHRGSRLRFMLLHGIHNRST